MTEKSTIQKDFIAMQADIRNPKRSKEVTVKLANSNGSYKFKYAPLDAILDELRPVLLKHNFAIAQGIERKEYGSILKTDLIHISGSSITSSLPFPDAFDSRIQDYGGKLTYFKRYGLCMALGISAEDDTDATDSKGKYTKTQIHAHIAKYTSAIAKTTSMRELMSTHGDYKEILEYAKIYFPDEVYKKSGDGMCAHEYFEFLYKSFRDKENQSDELEAANEQMDEEYKNTVGK